eukprot:214620-Rhodomonas_salina.1
MEEGRRKVFRSVSAPWAASEADSESPSALANSLRVSEPEHPLAAHLHIEWRVEGGGVAMSAVAGGVDIDNLHAQLLRARASNTALKDVLKTNGGDFPNNLNFNYGLQAEPSPADLASAVQKPQPTKTAPQVLSFSPANSGGQAAPRGIMQVDASTIDQLKATVESLLRDLNRSLKEKDALVTPAPYALFTREPQTLTWDTTTPGGPPEPNDPEPAGRFGPDAAGQREPGELCFLSVCCAMPLA